MIRESMEELEMGDLVVHYIHIRMPTLSLPAKEGDKMVVSGESGL